MEVRKSLVFKIDIRTGRTDPPEHVKRSRLESLSPLADGIINKTLLVSSGSFKRLPPGILEADHLLPQYRGDYFQRTERALQDYDNVQMFSFRDAIVTSHGAVITREGNLIDESCWELFANRVTPHNLTPDGPDRFRLTRTAFRRIEGRCLLAKRPWWSNYGHWLVDSAAPLALLSGRQQLSQIPIVIGQYSSQEMRRIVFETLAIVAPDNPILEHPDEEVWQFDHLDYLSPVHMSGEYKVPASLHALRTQINGTPFRPPVRRRLFLSRPSTRRRLENLREIVEISQEFGFETLNSENYPLSEQARIFAETEAFVGIKGAAFTNVIFSPGQATALLLSPGDWPDLFFWDICSAMGVEYSEIFGTLVGSGAAQGQNPFVIDPTVFRNTLAKMLERNQLPQRTDATQSVHRISPDSDKLYVLPDLQGTFYQEGLKLLHSSLKPKSYLEIGSLTGDTLRLSSCPSVAIDVEFRLGSGFPGAIPALHLFQMSSDEFFHRFSASQFVGPIHLAFLDGMHQFEFLLRDFIEVERHCLRNSTIVLHDCVPQDQYMARRNQHDVKGASLSRHPEWWAGDVWKVPVILRQYRSDLAIGIFDAPPTGLVIVRKLNPGSKVLSERYHEIIEAVRGWPADEFTFSSYLRDLDLKPTSQIPEFLASTFS